MNTNAKKEIQQKWMAEKVKVVVATTAFGMGIDKRMLFIIYSSK